MKIFTTRPRLLSRDLLHRSRALRVMSCAAAGIAVLGLLSEPGFAKSKERTVLMTEHDDERVGAESAESVAAQIGLMDDPELQAYLSKIGNRLLRGLPRRSFKYRFSVVDQTEANAFALPGGHIYISRGLLALANNEDELACVIGHEITHAAHRHAATQQALAKRSLFPSAVQMASYSRDMERDADHGGQILCAAAGYDPMGMSTFLHNLGQTERMRIGYSRGPGFFDSHPGSRERAAANAARANEIRRSRNPALGDTQASLFEKIDGLAVGQRPKAGVFRGDQFLHPDMNFELRFPPGWRKSNTNMAVVAFEPRGQAMVYLKAEMPEGEAREMAETWFEENREDQKLDLEESKPVKVGRADAWRMKISASGRRGGLISYVTFIPYNGATWSITGLTPSYSERQFLGRTLLTARSFRPLSEEARKGIQSMRLRVVKARQNEDIQSLSARSGNGWNVANTAIFNGIFVNHRFERGDLVKIIKTEPYIHE
jgi:predicted Zn-dependent protease